MQEEPPYFWNWLEGNTDWQNSIGKASVIFKQIWQNSERTSSHIKAQADVELELSCPLQPHLLSPSLETNTEYSLYQTFSVEVQESLSFAPRSPTVS